MGDERRMHDRFALSQNVDLMLPDSGVVRVKMVNVSESGMLCRSGENIADGTKISFKLKIPTKGSTMSVDCEGIVLRCTASGSEFNVVVKFSD